MEKKIKVLSIETSCDDTSVAIVDNKGWVYKQLSAHQDLQHAPFGGIVPEIASRNHSISLLPLIDHLLKQTHLKLNDLNGVAVTNRPGLIGSLIVGIMSVKAIHQSLGLPMIGVNHLEGHLLAPFLRDESYAPPDQFDYPYVALAVSGGHSSLYWVEGLGKYTVIGTTKDDAAGEAFDKFAKLVGLGYPGGALVDVISKTGQINKYDFPRSLILEDNLMMSFSGLKSSAVRLLSKMSDEDKKMHAADLCASFQEAIVDVLIKKLESAVRRYKAARFVITGGVSANTRLRQRADEWAQKNGLQHVTPPLRYCTDNAAMIGFTGALRLARGESSPLSLGPHSVSLESDFKYDLQ